MKRFLGLPLLTFRGRTYKLMIIWLVVDMFVEILQGRKIRRKFNLVVKNNSNPVSLRKSNIFSQCDSKYFQLQPNVAKLLSNI
jgi:hypothetical protein